MALIPAKITDDGFIDPVEYHGSAHITALTGAEVLFLFLWELRGYKRTQYKHSDTSEKHMNMDLPEKFKVLIVTLSDRASRGEYRDLSGPEIMDQLARFFKSLNWSYNIGNEDNT
jgi:hypothetical protein